MDEERTLKREVFESRLKALDEKVVKATQQDEAKFRTMREQLVKVQEAVHHDRLQRDAQDERVRQRDVKLIDQTLQKELARDRQTRKDYEIRILK